MARATLKHVISASASERGFEAQNLLHGTSDKRSKWLGKAGAKCNSVILKLDREYKFTNFHVGNANSAFVEIFVSRSVDTQETFQVIVPSTSFMSQMESRSEKPGDRVRIFGVVDMIPSVESLRWDIVKVVCHQPFNDRVPFGLGFFKVDGTAEEIVSPSKSQSSVPPISMNFIDLDSATQSSQSLSTGSLFERRDEMKKDREDYEKRVEKERRIAMLSKDGGKGFKKEAKKTAATHKDTYKPKPKKEKSVEKIKNNYIEMIDLEDERKEQPGTSKRRKDSPTPSSQGPSEPKRRVVIESDEEDETEDWPSTSTKNSSQNNSQSLEKIDEILKGVCFSLSGYQNPMRSDLRDKAVEMGAKYCNDWTPECTHLISAFKNTPKMRQIGKSATAVSGRWIRRCYAEKKRLPESKYPVTM
ncbi:hypothetical protein QR680_008601 [Steinernema hermaphroditum]|uniref:BRCT domain-containing protein n=1 Tax=Steinernema hermaphroditum TaxID=289476 RepID=A0AA39IJM1_9BILA|nr:hypothetical protein QR680_008601 [Steinernema hermaphroditum]